VKKVISSNLCLNPELSAAKLTWLEDESKYLICNEPGAVVWLWGPAVTNEQLIRMSLNARKILGPVCVPFCSRSRLGGVVFSVLATGKSIAGSRWIFKGDKNPQHTFLRMGSKAGGLMS
jgi:hypothetical protein